jgi:arylsulfatase A-like enzyme
MPGRRLLLASLTAALGLAGLAVSPLAGCRRSESAPSIVLVTVDTLRADALGAYGARPSRTPRLDRLAAESTLFERATAPMPLTRPSHFSILTSRYPREHGVLNNRIALPESERTLAEILAEHGYRTAAFVAVSLLARGSGFEQGFETVEGPAGRQRAGGPVVEQALAWVDSLGPAERFLLWVHLFDPHEPYAPPPEHRLEVDRELGQRLPSVGWQEIYETARENDGDVPRAVLEHAKALYRGEVSATDTWIGALLDGLAARGRGLEETIVVVTADHGECFEDGVYFEHAHCLRDPAIRVPLLVRYPPGFPPGARVSSVVSTLDIAPTLLAAVGIEPPADWSGRRLRASDGADPRYVLIQYPYYEQRAVTGRLEKRREVVKTVAGEPTLPVLIATEKVGLVGPDWTYLRARGPEGASEELYPSAGAPGEGHGAPEARPGERERLAALLDEALRKHPLHLIEAGKVNPEMLETLRALGYVE